MNHEPREETQEQRQDVATMHSNHNSIPLFQEYLL